MATGGRSLGLSSDDGKYRQRFPDPVIQKNVPYKVVVKVRKGVQATVNGTVVVNVQTDFQDMKVTGNVSMNGKIWQSIAMTPHPSPMCR